jgi:hypothetical protein
MEYQQARIAALEEQEKAITPDPIVWPAKKEGDTTALVQTEIFFRLLNGISTTPDRQPLAGKVPIYRYKATSNGFAFSDVLVGAIKSVAADQFKKDVLKQLKITANVLQPRELGQQLGQPITFDYYHDERGNNPYVYFHDGHGYLVVVVYRPAPKATTSQLKQIEPILEYSLATLTLGPAANRKVATWKSTQNKPPPKVAPSTPGAQTPSF